MFVHDGKVTWHHGSGAALDEAERFFLTWGVKVIEEDPSYAPSLTSVADIEVSVTPTEQKNGQKGIENRPVESALIV